VPEVVEWNSAEPENPEALADGITRLYRDPCLCSSLASAGCQDVERFGARVAGLFCRRSLRLRRKWRPGVEHADRSKTQYPQGFLAGAVGGLTACFA
jgi:hypothetical protein